MAAIIQAEHPEEQLSRKIGFSVGVEYLVARVKDIVQLYCENRGLSVVSYRDLVENKWNRGKVLGGRESQLNRKTSDKKATYEHFADVYKQLNLLWLNGRELEPLHQLETLSILRGLFSADEIKFDSSVKVVLSHAVIEADGDIFLNCLLGDFKPERVKVLLSDMISTKCRVIDQVFKNPSIRKRIHGILSIGGQQGSNQNMAQEETNKFGRRTTPIDSGRRKSKIDDRGDEIDTQIPDDYLRKVPTSRRNWATDFGFFKDARKTDAGENLIRELLDAKVIQVGSEGSLLFWGYGSDLAWMRIKLSELKPPIPSPDDWDLLGAIARSYFASQQEPQLAPYTSDELFEFLQKIYHLYRKSRRDKEMIRNFLPLYVAEPVLVASCVAENRPVPNLPEFLKREFNKTTVRRLQKMIIRGTAGALFFMGEQT